ncbi:glucoamylase-like protein [Trypanosoma rangeli]|uniref:Glucoamylase-like protein n=1 Tax=Trypanosoma rangeli TaxID=5698 RepID=A0A3R7NB47_TRYRA|nr:glucoamylase-like protein [Trypanosoma rangeli]RNF03553.1 glucoamylase-like protein [Trypanosoma rangeli]|eukprot:RNF03553.1 glucoamylase-like protein [Trypanosoma rangeli]
MPGAPSPIAIVPEEADCILHENPLKHRRGNNATRRRHTPWTAPQLSQHDCHYHQHHQQQQQNEHLLAHTRPSNAQSAPLLRPHIHSMLYHCIIGHAAEPSSSQEHRKKVVPVGNSLPFPATSLHTPNHPHHQLKSNTTCNIRAPVFSNLKSSTLSEEAGVTPTQVAVITPSPYSENASLGNGSGSPATTRGCQTTGTKRPFYNSPMVYSPDVSPSKGDGHSSTELVGRALEDELKAAEKDELLQVLLELSSCSEEAARFIQSKAILFSLRRATMLGRRRDESTDSTRGGELVAPTTNNAASSPGKTPERKPHTVSFGILDRCCDSTHVTPSKLLAFEESTSLSNSCEKFAFAGGASPANLSPRNKNSMQMHLLTSSDRTAARGCEEEKCTSIKAALAGIHVKAEDRPWCDEVHPCLKWYRSCRHPTSCPFASSPRNLCLNWVRASCMMGQECSGVHRLPDACSSEVLTVFALCHGADRAAVAHQKLQLQLLQHPNQTLQHPSYCRKQQLLYADSKSQGCEGLNTPIGQIISDFAGIPASLEHYYHELRHVPQATASPSQQKRNDDGHCHCLSCRTPSDKFELLAQTHEDHAWRQLQHLPPTATRPVSRCLNESFTAAECLESTIAGGVTERSSWAEPASLLTRPLAAKCGAEYEEEVTELFPPQNTYTRTQSPVTL